jgi:hypothetical protein
MTDEVPAAQPPQQPKNPDKTVCEARKEAGRENEQLRRKIV